MKEWTYKSLIFTYLTPLHSYGIAIAVSSVLVAEGEEPQWNAVQPQSNFK